MLRYEYGSVTFQPLKKNMTDDGPTNQPTDQQTDMRVHRKVTHPIIVQLKIYHLFSEF